MDVCYGCLYDFTRNHRVPTLPPADGRHPTEDRPLAAPPPGARPAEPHVALADDLDEPPSPEATVVLARPAATPPAAISDVPSVLVRTGDMDVTVEVPESGLHVGRAPSNDVVLHSKAVSREHVVLVPAEGGLIVRDLGSTNPPLVGGRPIEGSALVPFGGAFAICGSSFEPCRR